MNLPVFTAGIVFILIALYGGKFKILGAEISEMITSKWVKFACLVIGIGFLLIAFNINPLARMQTPMNNVDLPGGDLSDLTTDSAAVCESKCQDNPLCKAYTFRSSDSTCFLKNSQPDPEPRSGLVSGKKL